MKLEATSMANYKLVVDEEGTPIGVQKNGVVEFRVNDTVQVTGDSRGYICPGIKTPGRGRIFKIRRNDTDHFFGVLMENGEFGYMKDARMTRC